MTTTSEPMPEDLASGSLSGAAAERYARLSARVGRVRTRAGTGSLDRWLLIIGGILMPLGFMVIVLGWIGASHTVLLFEQIPYLVSGGILGLAFVFAGGFVYFAYWQTVLVRDTRAERRELVDALARIETLLAAPRDGSPSVSSPPGSLVATPGGSMFHRPDCPVVAGRESLRDVAAGGEGLTACSICDPLAAG